MINDKEVAILYSGGTDSTCVAAIMAEKFQAVHLLTFLRFGFYCIENSKNNINVLKLNFPATVFIHKIINVDRLAMYLTYHNYIYNIFKYGFFVLSNCLICGLINHFRALVYCLDNKISKLADGSTRDWIFFPTHMDKVILELRCMYAHFNIEYLTPVYNFDLFSPPKFIDKIYPSSPYDKETNKKTTGNYLFEKGIFKSPNIKGTDFDRKMQPRCFQFILHHIYIYWYFMIRYEYTDFEAITLKFFKEKINDFVKLIENEPKKVRKIILK